MSSPRRMPSSLALYFGGEAVATPELEHKFFTKVRLPNGSYKTTYRRRLDDLNEMVLELLPRDRDLSVMDVAASSGISSIEWSDHLRAHGIRHKMVAGDLVDAWLASWGTSFAVLFDGSGRTPLLFEVGSLTLRTHSDRWPARVVRPVLFPLLRAVAAMSRRSGCAAPMTPPAPRRWIYRPIQLVSPKLLRQAEIAVVQDDITMPGTFGETFDAIRVANLLHRAYFDDETLTDMLRNLRGRLPNGGVLALCRTMEDGTNQATAFRRRGDRFVIEASLNGGVEVRDLVLALGSPDDAAGSGPASLT
jgi:hypothetical protein